MEEFGKDRKGIVYAINISHANAIAEFYREHGIAAVAIAVSYTHLWFIYPHILLKNLML